MIRIINVYNVFCLIVMSLTEHSGGKYFLNSLYGFSLYIKIIEANTSDTDRVVSAINDLSQVRLFF